MKILKGLVAAFALTAGSNCLMASNANAAGNITGHIVSMYGGWNVPMLRLVLDVPFSNPDGCSLTDGYEIADTLAANQQFTSMAFLAFSTGNKVMITVSGCYQNRPSVIGMQVGGLS